MKAKEIFKKISKKMSLKAKIITVVSTLAVIAIIITIPFISNSSAEVDTIYLGTVLQKAGELTTAKLTYTGLTEYTDEGIDIINKQNFTMVYSATARFGIDVTKVKITANDALKKIYVEIPASEVQDVNVDTSSIKYYNTQFSIFNPDQKEDNNKAIALAKEEAKKEAVNMGILEMADRQAEDLIKGILADAIPDGYTIERK